MPGLRGGVNADVALSARQALALLVDPGSFTELGGQARHQSHRFGLQAKRPPGDGVVTGTARVGGRPVAVYAQDPTVLGGSLGETHARKIAQVLELAARGRIPAVGLLDSGGARIQEGVGALDGYGRIFRHHTGLSGRVPQISVVLGPCAGGAAYAPALTDLVVMARGRAHMFLTGPRVVQAVTGERVSADDLGGPDVHGGSSGVAHLVADGVEDALMAVRAALSYLPSSCDELPPFAAPSPPFPLPDVPADHRLAYDVRTVIEGVVDRRTFLELHPEFARNIVVGFARLEGRSVGVVASQPAHLAGCLDIAASEKAARFVRLCDAFHLPILTLVDVPGFLPGSGQEADGIIRKGAKLLYAYAEATVPKVTVVLRKAFGGAYIVMGSKSLGADVVFAWEGAQLAVMGADGAVDIVFRRELETAPERREELVEAYTTQVMSADAAAERLSVDEIIAPAATRAAVAGVLAALCAGLTPGFRHDNLPQ